MLNTTASASSKDASAARTCCDNAVSEPIKLLERIGSATIEVSIHFSKTSKETMGDKILRILQGSREIEDFLGATERSSSPPPSGSSPAQSVTKMWGEVTGDAC